MPTYSVLVVGSDELVAGPFDDAASAYAAQQSAVAQAAGFGPNPQPSSNTFYVAESDS